MARKYADETAEDFSSRLFGVINDGFVTLSIAFGIKSGLFDVLVEHHQTPMTSQEIADIAGMKERYVKEWLGAVASARIVEMEPSADAEKYYLPAHRINSFKAGTVENHVANSAKGIPLLGEVFNPMLEALKKDGPRGLSFAISRSFNEYDEDYSAPWYQHCLLQEFIPSVPEIQTKLESGIQMLDVGCGRGAATRILAKQFPNSHFVGLDIRNDNVDVAKKEASSLELTNLEYVCADATKMPADWTTSFDYVFFFNVLHDAPRPDLIIDEVKRVIKADGRMSVIEFDVDSKHRNNIESPGSAFMYTISLFHCLPVSYNFPGSHGLGLMWGKDRILEFLKEKGFLVKNVSRTPMVQEAHFMCELSPQ